VIHDWREGVKTYLQSAFAAAEVVAGEREGVWRADKDLIAVWWPGWDELTRDIALASPTLTLRYFPARSKQPTDDQPTDPAPLELAGDALLAAFDRASQAVGFFAADLSCRLARLRPNYDPAVWRVEGTLIAYTLGQAA
jgi:hypothetical protein